MCELFALSARRPTNVRISLGELMQHGGGTGDHEDGWGVAFFHGRDAQVIREPHAAASSPLARLVRESGVRSHIVVSHVRKATLGSVRFANTHPFARELGGRMHVFAHNGHLPGLADCDGIGPSRFHPLGDTDSEQAFCGLLGQLEPLWDDHTPTAEERFEVVARFARAMRGCGVANFLYADSELLFIHGHRKPRRDDDEPIVAGLHWLERSCAVDFDAGGVSFDEVNGPQRVLLAATVPLSDEGWTPLPAEGSLMMVAAGEVLRTLDAGA
jgi:glutamine amidotransferase